MSLGSTAPALFAGEGRERSGEDRDARLGLVLVWLLFTTFAHAVEPSDYDKCIEEELRRADDLMVKFDVDCYVTSSADKNECTSRNADYGLAYRYRALDRCAPLIAPTDGDGA